MLSHCRIGTKKRCRLHKPHVYQASLAWSGGGQERFSEVTCQQHAMLLGHTGLELVSMGIVSAVCKGRTHFSGYLLRLGASQASSGDAASYDGVCTVLSVVSTSQTEAH